jgi:hypothetical protein
MFGNPHPPQPPRFEGAVVVVLAIVIAAALTLAACSFWLLVDRLREAG